MNLKPHIKAKRSFTPYNGSYMGLTDTRDPVFLAISPIFIHFKLLPVEFQYHQ